ncbi:MAG: ATP-binding protein [Lachnospiraceae bacterium]|nr:ATP-binding protein [Lachnospiraceae bacterium]
MKKSKRFVSIRAKTMINILVPVIISFTLVISVLFYFLFSSIEESAKSQLTAIGNKYAVVFEKQISEAINYLNGVSSVLEYAAATQTLSREDLQVLIYKIFDDFGILDGSSIYFEANMFDGKDAEYIDTYYGSSLSGKISYFFYRDDGKTAYLPEAMPNDIEFELPHYYDTKAANEPIYTEPFVYEIDGRIIPMITLTHPVRDVNQQFIGAVTVDLFLDDLHEKLRDEQVFTSGYILISNRREQIISSPRFEDIGKGRAELGLDYALPSGGNDLLHTKGKSIVDNRDTLVSVHSIFIPHLDTYFFISAQAPVEEINAEADLLVTLTIIFSVIVFLAIIVLMNITVNQASRPLKEIMETVNKIARGEFKSRIEGNYKSEFAIIKESINVMADNIESHIYESDNSRKILSNIMNGLDAYIYATIPDTGEILFMNDNMKEHFGIEGEVVGQTCYKVLQDDYPDRCQFCPCHELDKDPDKTIIWEEHNSVTKRDYKNTDCYIEWLGGVKVHLQHSVDITDLKSAMSDKLEAERSALEFKLEKEKAEETSQIKSDFLANMSHEIRTPMNAIMGMSELLQNEKLTERQRNYVNDINHSSHSLLGIINDILDFSKIEAGKLELAPVDYDFYTFLDNFHSTFKFIAGKNNLEFRYEKSNDIPRYLYGDDIRLRQVLTNICGNSVKFTSAGYIRFSINSDENSIIFEIEDTGMGIKEEDLPKLFKAFAQADTQKNRSIKGTGLGLVICKSFVEMMNGTIAISSVYGKGTIFTVKVPIVAGKEVTLINTISHQSDFAAPKAKILVVDDNEINLKVATGLLRLHEIEAQTAISGFEAIKMVQDTDYDIVFMDHMMPEMDGIETTEAIRKLGGKFANLIIIALTANAIRGAKEMFLKHEFNGFLSKPIDTSYLIDILREFLPAGIIIEKIFAEDEGAASETETPLDFLDKISKISAINTEIGLSRFAGIEAECQETLAIFYQSLLKDTAKIEGLLKDKDIEKFAIYIHSLKSTLSTIGVMHLSLLAQQLEDAAKDNNLEYCEAKGPELFDELHSLHNALKPLFTENEIQVQPIREAGEIGYLREGIEKALNAADNFDSDLCLAAFKELLAYDFGIEVNQNLEAAKKAVLGFDFDSVVEVLSKI